MLKKQKNRGVGTRATLGVGTQATCHFYLKTKKKRILSTLSYKVYYLQKRALKMLQYSNHEQFLK